MLVLPVITVGVIDVRPVITVGIISKLGKVRLLIQYMRFYLIINYLFVYLIIW